MRRLRFGGVFFFCCLGTLGCHTNSALTYEVRLQAVDMWPKSQKMAIDIAIEHLPSEYFINLFSKPVSPAEKEPTDLTSPRRRSFFDASLFARDEQRYALPYCYLFKGSIVNRRASSVKLFYSNFVMIYGDKEVFPYDIKSYQERFPSQIYYQMPSDLIRTKDMPIHIAPNEKKVIYLLLPAVPIEVKRFRIFFKVPQAPSSTGASADPSEIVYQFENTIRRD